MSKKRIQERNKERSGNLERFFAVDAVRAVEGSERKFVISFSSEEPYRRWWGTEILSHEEKAVELTRLNTIGVVLYNHNRDAVIGKITKAWIENMRGQAEIEFDTDEASEVIYQKVKSGTLKGVSVGYQVNEEDWEDVKTGKKSKDGRFTGPCSIATRWTPFEVSIVSVPADASVGVGRSFDDLDEGVSGFYYNQKQLQINSNLIEGGTKMTLEQMRQRQQELLDTAEAANREFTEDEQREFDDLTVKIKALASKTPEPTAEPTPAPDTEAVREAERKKERERIREIESMCEHFNIDSRDYVDNGTSVEETRKDIMQKLMDTSKPVSQNARVEITEHEEDKFRAAAADAILMRSGIELEKPAAGARDLMGLSIRDLFIECESRSGATGLLRKSADELYNLATRQYLNPTAVFPAILDTVVNKAWAEGHKKANVTFDRFTKKGSLKDFKVNGANYLMGPAGEFKEVPEGGELVHDVIANEKMPTRQLKTYGRQFTLTRQAFINDDIDMISKVPAKYAAAARKTINKQVYQILVNNPAIYDGVALFHATHKNLLTTGTGITQGAVQAMITALNTQKDQFGEPILVRPGAIVVPAGLSFDIYTLFQSQTINTAGNTQAANPVYDYRSKIEVIEDPTLNALCGDFGNVMPWFMLGDKDDTDFIEVDYLNGQEIPNIRRSEPTGQLGFVWDVYLDWGISVMDFRGAIKNPGVQVDSPL